MWPVRERLGPRPLQSITKADVEDLVDMRLCRLGQSQVTVMASADVRREAVSGLLRLPRLSLSRRIRFTTDH